MTLPTPPYMRVRIRRFDKVANVCAVASDAICSARYWTDRVLFQSETLTIDSRLVSQSTLALHRPVGLLNLWSPCFGSREFAGLLAWRGSLASSRSKALPCSSSFGPSCLDWNSRISTTTSADPCTARTGFHRSVPRVQASLTCGSDTDTHVGHAGLPG